MGKLRFVHLILPLIFGLIILSAVNHEQQDPAIFETPEFTVALNQLYVHCNHRGWQEIRILLTTRGKAHLTINRIYISYDDGRKFRLPVPEIDLAIQSDDVREFPIILSGMYLGLNERQHGKTPHITIMLTYGNSVFWIKNSGPIW